MQPEDVILAFQRRADRNAHGHIGQALRLKLLDDLSTFVATIGGAAVMAGGAVILGNENPIREIEISISIIGAVITLIGVWQAVWQPGRRSREHKHWSGKFSQIEDDCRLTLCKEIHTSPIELAKRLGEISEEAELVSEFFWRRSPNKSKNEGSSK